MFDKYTKLFSELLLAADSRKELSIGAGEKVESFLDSLTGAGAKTASSRSLIWANVAGVCVGVPKI